MNAYNCMIHKIRQDTQKNQKKKKTMREREKNEWKKWHDDSKYNRPTIYYNLMQCHWINSNYKIVLYCNSRNRNICSLLNFVCFNETVKISENFKILL